MRELFEGIDWTAQNATISGFDMNIWQFGSLNPQSSARIQLKCAQELLINPNLKSLDSSQFAFNFCIWVHSKCLFFAPVVLPIWFPNLCSIRRRREWEKLNALCWWSIAERWYMPLFSEQYVVLNIIIDFHFPKYYYNEIEVKGNVSHEHKIC